MTEQTDNRWLIVEPVPAADERVEAVLPELARRYRVDTYIARQRLVGRSPTLLAKGSAQTLAGAVHLLSENGFTCRVILPTPPRFAPQRLLALALSGQTVTFHCEHQEVTLESGEAVIGILADISDHLVEKSLKRLMMQNAYRGADHIVPLSEGEIYQAILHGAPVFDFYILSPDGGVRAAVRVFPGRFNPSGLGKKATYSVVGNLEAVIETVRARVGHFVLNTDFGLAYLPGCQPQRAGDGSDNRKENLRSLTRYGWLTVDLIRAAPSAPAPSSHHPPVPVMAIAGLAAGAPVLAAAAGATPVGGGRSGKSVKGSVPASPAADPGLPAPPEAAAEDGESSSRWLPLLGGILGALIGLLLFGGQHLLAPFLTSVITTGLLPAILAAGCFVGGVHFLRLKQQIENTPTSRIRSLAVGMVEVRGRAVRLYSVVSPLSQMACVYYRLHRFCRESNGWRLTSTDSSGAVPFALEDETGRITVDPRGAVVRPHTRQEGVPGGTAMFTSSAFGDGQEKWVEEIIAEGTPLYILGFAQSRRVPGTSLHERTLATLHHYKEDPRTMQRFDTDGDGYISPEEWEAARAAAEEEALAASLVEEDHSRRQEEQVVIGRPEGRSLPFIIAETPSEARLTRSFGLLIVPLLAGGMLFAVWAAVLFLRHLKGF